MTEATLKEGRKYYATFKTKVNYVGTDIKTEKYISGYFDEMASADELMETLNNMMADERYFKGYEIIDYHLVNVKHQKNAAY